MQSIQLCFQVMAHILHLAHLISAGVGCINRCGANGAEGPH